MSDPLTEAREALAQIDHPCGVRHSAPDLEGVEEVCALAPGHLGAHYGYGPFVDWKEHLRAALAEVDRLTARVAELEPFLDFHRGKVDGLNARITQSEQDRAGDVAGIVAWLRKEGKETADTAKAHRSAPTRRAVQHTAADYANIANRIERGDWRDAPLPPDPRDARIAALEAEVAGLRAVADTVTGGGSR